MRPQRMLVLLFQNPRECLVRISPDVDSAESRKLAFDGTRNSHRTRNRSQLHSRLAPGFPRNLNGSRNCVHFTSLFAPTTSIVPLASTHPRSIAGVLNPDESRSRADLHLALHIRHPRVARRARNPQATRRSQTHQSTRSLHSLAYRAPHGKRAHIPKPNLPLPAPFT